MEGAGHQNYLRVCYVVVVVHKVRAIRDSIPATFPVQAKYPKLVFSEPFGTLA